MGLRNLKPFFSDAAEKFKEVGNKKPEVFVIHHDDADGLCSAAIMLKTLERERVKPSLLCIEKILPEIVEKLHRKKGAVFFYCDIGSPHADMISRFNKSKNLVLILDHHNPVKSEDPLVYNLNLEFKGLKGETDFSGATSAYLFSKTLNKENIDLSYLALVGSQELPNGLKSVNLEVLKEAVEKGVVSHEKGKIKIKKIGLTAKRLFSLLQILGPVAYYRNGPLIGVKTCLTGLNSETKELLKELEQERKEANKKMLAILYTKGLNQTKHIQWFDSENVYEGMGTKVVGTFCSYLTFQKRLINEGKYLFGTMPLKPEIPGFGKLNTEYLKISVRIPAKLKKEIMERTKPSAIELLNLAVKGYGIADGHDYAASALIPSEKKEEFLAKVEEIVANWGPPQKRLIN